MSALITLIVWLLVVGILIALVYYVVDAIPLPAPFNRWIKLAVTVVAALLLIALLLQMIGVNTGVDLPKIN